MHGEQPPKTICEICGGIHPTISHPTVSEPKIEVEASPQEKELSPEIIERIMDKVEDINRFGIAFHTIGANRKRQKNSLEDILRDGVLGITAGSSQKKYKEEFNQRKTWMADVRKRNELPMVWFDVLGDYPKSCPTIKDCYWVGLNPVRPLNITIIFDLQKYNDPVGTREDFSAKLKKLKDDGSPDPLNDFIKQCTQLGNFMPADTQGPAFHGGNWAGGLPNQARGGHDEGHVLFGGIPPRYFRGIVIQYFESSLGHPSEAKEETDPKLIQEKVNEIAGMMLTVDKDKPQLLLPIYDSGGNLLWPKHMTHEEVAQYVAEKSEEKK